MDLFLGSRGQDMTVKQLATDKTCKGMEIFFKTLKLPIY
jgi:hypothetical protein